jgi:hypothetical protein
MSGLSSPRILFGVHCISPYSRVDKTPYGILKVVGSASISLQASVEQLYAGASRFSWAAESKTISSDVSAKVKAYPGFLFQLFLGATNTDNAAEALASATALTNFKGTSCMSATAGIASVGITTGNETNVKFVKFMVKVVSATTVDVYAFSDVDFARGSTQGLYQSDLLKVTATPLTIAMGATVVIPEFGLQFVGGSGTIAMTIGDTAYFSSRPENTLSSDIIVGNAVTTLPAFGAVFLAQKRVTGEMCEIEAFNVIGSGMPIPLDEMAFSTTELKMTCLYDAFNDAVFKIRYVNPVTVT